MLLPSPGRGARWRGDGKELFYLAPDGKLMAAPIQAVGQTLEAGARAVGAFPDVHRGRRDRASGGQHGTVRMRITVYDVLEYLASGITTQIKDFSAPAAVDTPQNE